ELSAAFERAIGGGRELVLVAGEPGIGKTSLVEAFLETLRGRGDVRIARADCVERYGAGEAYQPLLEALTRLGRLRDRAALVAALRHYAPTWLAQLPALESVAELTTLKRQAVGVTPARMLRELNDALEAVSATVALVVCLEDLHWSDASTLDWIAAFARRPERAPLLLIGTYRPEEPTQASRVLELLAADLRTRRLCRAISLESLDEPAVRNYVARRYPAAHGAVDALATLARQVYRRTEGNPLFLVNVLSDLEAHGALIETERGWTLSAGFDGAALRVPEDIRRLVEQRVERLEPAQRELLEVASVPGGPCSAAAVAAGTEREVEGVEAALRELTRRHGFVRETGVVEWPDGIVAARFEFLHSLFREVLGARLSPARRAELHRRIGLRLESAYGDRACEIAAELAVHFEEARDMRRAIEYLEHAAATDRARTANEAAAAHYRRALRLLERLPPSNERDELEARVRLGLGASLVAIRGFGSPEVEQCYARARALCQARGDTHRLLHALWGLWIFYLGRGEVTAARDLADRIAQSTSTDTDSSARLQTHHAQWATAFSEGDFRAVEAHAEHGMAIYDVRRHAALTSTYGDHDAGVCGLSFHARAAAFAGRAATAAGRATQAVALARELAHPFSLTLALTFSTFTRQALHDAAGTHASAVAAAQVADEHGFALMRSWLRVLEGWSLVELGERAAGLQSMRTGIAAAEPTKSNLFRALLLTLLAEAELRCELPEAARTSLDRAFELGSNGDRHAVAEMYRLRGELELAVGRDADARGRAEQYFGRAVEAALAQGADLLALRAATRLGRLKLASGMRAEAAATVGRARDAMQESTGLPDFEAASALLAECVADDYSRG
ncbi:MAG TPA: AAA family ATPase, partial [Gammaproteobacteria bacterium]|nr:AAA family ATPase [Gammaproteobacteria bacterium]